MFKKYSATSLLPWIFGVVNAAFTIYVFSLAELDPERSGLLPIVVFAVDLPVSFISIGLRIVCEMFIPQNTYVANGNLIDCILFLVIGVPWYALLGWLLGKFCKLIHRMLTGVR